MTTFKIAASLAAGFLVTAEASGQTLEFAGRDYSILGAYETEAGNRYIAGAYPGSDLLYVADAGTGVVKFLSETDKPARYSFTARRNPGDDVAGHVEFEGDTLRWIEGECVVAANRVDMDVTAVGFANGDAAHLGGWLITPPGDGPFPGAAMITQSSRFDLWEIAMHLVTDGMAVLVYDQRNNEPGVSTGEPVRGWYHEIQRVYASDAAAAVDFLTTRQQIDSRRIGVIGWSGGGWVGAIVASERDDLAFYVNVAGNASPFLEQAEHRLYARLFREGYPDGAIARAAEFLDLHHDVARGEADWERYAAAREAVAKEDWYVYLSENFNMNYEDLEDARKWGAASESAAPSDDFAGISAPTLGLFFEHDHSTPPSSPLLFHEALVEAESGDYEIVVLPDLNHGGWITPNGYRWTSDEIEGRSPEVMTIIRDWVGRQASG